ncbi:MAG: CRISPR-associated helicase Cas3' [Acidobacteria bacterium]|nr:MAG: CRISPR-associated helicase Cas3' [Acidobacteriota bacterium]
MKEKLEKLWAKSNGTSIRKHTDRLLENLKELKNLYGEQIEKAIPEEERELFWKILELACEYHDYGKIHCKFQEKVGNSNCKCSQQLQEVRHNLISPAFVKADDELVENIIALVVLHHHRYKKDKEEIKKLEEVLKEEFGKELCYRFLLKEDNDYAMLEKIEECYGKDYTKLYTLMKGFLLRIDHASSSKGGVVEKPLITDYQKRVEDYLKTQKNSSLNCLQEWVLENLEDNLLVIASTGMGKTEAGFLFLKGKGFFILPIRTSANGIYLRACDVFNEEDCGLLHSSSLNFLLFEKDGAKDHLNNNLDVGILDHIAESRNFAKPIIVCTPDQLFPFVFRFYGFEKYFSMFSYARVVLDEIQLYEPHTLGFLVFALKLIHEELGGKVMVMTATLPEFVREDLNFLRESDPFLFEKPRHHIKLEKRSILDEGALKTMIDKARENKVLVICNTVERAIELYKKLKEKNESLDIGLLHSRFMLKDRIEKEKEIKSFFDSEERSGIWITTQLAEVSLDLDADLLFTELSPADSLFQRFGRVNRKGRKNTDKPNAFIFTEDCSGVGSVYRKALFELTKEKLKDGTLGEEDKVSIVKEIYSKDTLSKRDDKYLKEYEEAKDYLKSLWEMSVYIKEGFSKKEAQKLFRDIDNVLVIPEEFRQYVEKLLEKMEAENKKNGESEKYFRDREEIYKYSISVPKYWLNKKVKVKGAVGNLKPKIFYIEGCSYDEHLGLYCAQEESLGEFI